MESLTPEQSVLDDFKDRKTKSTLSNSALADRAGVSLNTVKAYLRGDPSVRDTNVQKMHEALNAYVAEQREAFESTGNNVKRLPGGRVSSMTLLRDAADAHERFTEKLRAAIAEARKKKVALDTEQFERIELSLMDVEGALNMARRMVAPKP